MKDALGRNDNTIDSSSDCALVRTQVRVDHPLAFCFTRRLLDLKPNLTFAVGVHRNLRALSTATLADRAAVDLGSGGRKSLQGQRRPVLLFNTRAWFFCQD